MMAFNAILALPTLNIVLDYQSLLKYLLNIKTLGIVNKSSNEAQWSGEKCV